MQIQEETQHEVNTLHITRMINTIYTQTHHNIYANLRHPTQNEATQRTQDNLQYATLHTNRMNKHSAHIEHSARVFQLNTTNLQSLDH